MATIIHFDSLYVNCSMYFIMAHIEQIESVKKLKKICDGFSTTHPTELQTQTIRPFGEFSTFICKDLGICNAAIRERVVSPIELFSKIDTLVRNVSPQTIVELKSNELSHRNAAMTDLLFAKRSLDVAFQNDESYMAKFSGSDLVKRTHELSKILKRPPYLIWPDTANNYPSKDPRSFLEDDDMRRKQEIELYILNGCIDLIFKDLVVRCSSDITLDTLNQFSTNLEVAASAMNMFSKVRKPGHFDLLAPFSGKKDSTGRIPASGDFSVWSSLAGFLLTGRETFKERLLNSNNWPYYDPDSKQYINLLKIDAYNTLEELLRLKSPKSTLAELMLERSKLECNFSAFYQWHHGAVVRHANPLLNEPSHTIPEITNRQSIHRARGISE